MSKIIHIKTAKQRIDRKRHAALVLAEFDRQSREGNRAKKEKRSETERKARNAL